MSISVSKAAVTALVSLAATGCGASQPPPHLRIFGGDAEAGRKLVHDYGCGTCHTIPGISGARGAVGPSLEDFAQRTVFAGAYPNAPRTLVPWLMDPPAMRPGTAMPRLGVSKAEAMHIATYLYTLGAGGAAIYQMRVTDAQYPWLAEARTSRAKESERLNELLRVSPQRARIPIDQVMELLATRPESF